MPFRFRVQAPGVALGAAFDILWASIGLFTESRGRKDPRIARRGLVVDLANRVALSSGR